MRSKTASCLLLPDISPGDLAVARAPGRGAPYGAERPPSSVDARAAERTVCGTVRSH